MKRVLVAVAGVLILGAVAVLVSLALSPWPSLAIITSFLSYGDRKSDAALETRVPPGIAAQRDIAYGPSSDEVFDLYHREGARARPAIVWVHGGAFVAGTKNGVANYLKILAAHGYTTIAVEYSKGPGTTYPKPVEQVNAALGFVVRHAADLKVDPASIMLAGDSAGAHIAAQLALVTTNPAYASVMGISPQLKPAQLAAMLLVSGVYDPVELNLGGFYGWFNETVLTAYSGTKNFRNDARFKLTSLTHYVTGGFPPTFISSGNADPLAPQAALLATRLRDAGVHVDALFFPENRLPRLAHEYQFNLGEPAGQEALRRICAFLDAAASPASTGSAGVASSLR
jgi:acetyl esterase/lipase